MMHRTSLLLDHMGREVRAYTVRVGTVLRSFDYRSGEFFPNLVLQHHLYRKRPYRVQTVSSVVDVGPDDSFLIRREDGSLAMRELKRVRDRDLLAVLVGSEWRYEQCQHVLRDPMAASVRDFLLEKYPQTVVVNGFVVRTGDGCR